MPNMAKHNKIVLQSRPNPNRTTPPCNCRNKANCPLVGKCRESSIIYKATLKFNGIARHYYGCSETKFKIRFNNHKQSRAHRHKRNTTELSKAVWNAKDAGTNPSIEWSIAAKTSSYQSEAKSCNLRPRNSLFYNPIPHQSSIKEQQMSSQKQVQIEKFYCVVMLIECDA